MNQRETLRKIFLACIGHVDHGKTKILDKIRGTATQLGEAGGITQAIGASIIPIDTIFKICGSLIKEKSKFTIPGLLIIDTPGHAAFTTLRKRGGSISDIAILVVDINDGFKPQTYESIEILKNSKTPFVIAANKIDLINGYKQIHKNLILNINSQQPFVQERIETKTYEIVGKLSELGFESERFDRVEDFTKQVGIVPTSAITGDGIPELLMVIMGLAQKYLEQNLKLNVEGHAKGTVLEIKETKGLGKTLDTIIYDGVLSKGDSIVIGGIDKPIITRVKALFEPAPLSEMRDKKSKFIAVKCVTAATGVKICAIDSGEVIPGMPLSSFDSKNKVETINTIQKEVEEVLIKTDSEGVVIKADTLGSLEALTFLLKEKGIPVRKATIGKISKKDLTDAECSYEKNPLLSVILGFNTDFENDLEYTDKVKVITNVIIYRIIEEYEQWVEQKKREMEEDKLDELVRPCKIQLLPNYVFRQNNPAICGIEVMEGKLRVGYPLMKDGRTLTSVRSIQKEKDNVQFLEKGQQAAISMDGVTVGRQINEGDIMFTAIPEYDFREIKKFLKLLTQPEIELLKKIAEIMRDINPVWGI